MGFLSILATPLGYIMEWIYLVIPSYGWALIIFTLVTKLLMFPLSVKQQKSTARMSAYQPMMQEIQNKWKNDKNRMNEEMMKFQQESGYSMTAGCLPMVLNMFVIFGLFQVVYKPIQYLFHVPAQTIAQAMEYAGIAVQNSAAESQLITAVQRNAAEFVQFFGDKTDAIEAFNFNFLGMDLSVMPQFAWTGAAIVSLIMPVLAIVSMLAVQVITTKMSGQQMQGSMKFMMWFMSLSFGWFCFTVPIGFSLYYAMSNIFGFIQSVILKKMYDPEVMKQQIAQEIAEKRAAKKQKKQITLQAEDGTVVEKDVTEAELARIRLAKAREMDAQMYGD